jgi:hypothetical protein
MNSSTFSERAPFFMGSDSSLVPAAAISALCGLGILWHRGGYRDFTWGTGFNVPMQEHETRKTHHKEADKDCKCIEEHERRLDGLNSSRNAAKASINYFGYEAYRTLALLRARRENRPDNGTLLPLSRQELAHIAAWRWRCAAFSFFLCS